MAVRFLFPLAIFIVLAISFSGDVKADPVNDCTEGCYVITCDEGLCTLWRCDALGCRVVTTWQPEVDELESGVKQLGLDSTQSPAYGPESPTPGCHSIAACAVKTCDGAECTVWGLTGNTKKMLGVFDDSSEAARSIVEEFYAPSGADK